jgi:diguanylate cyclase (GGDEF)-like protein/PAS domain S-box-containing protein
VKSDLKSDQQSEQRFRLLVDAVQDYAIYLLDAEGKIVTWNSGAERNKGYSSSEILGEHFSRFFRPDDIAAGVPAGILATAAETGRFHGEGWRVRKDGSLFWASVVVNALRDDEGRVTGFAKITRDLTERKHQQEALLASEAALQAERDRLQVTLHSIGDGLIATDSNGAITLMNAIAQSMTGWTSGEALGRPLEEIFNLVDSDTDAFIDNPLRECLLSHKAVTLQDGAALVARDGTKRDIQDSVAPIRTAKGEIMGAICVFQDVSRMRTIQREMAFNASHDSLTQLPNRKLLLDSLQAAMVSARKTGIHHSLCFVDLDRFKAINDTAGHAAGDVLLRLVADLLVRHLEGGDLVARLGGDEFAIILYRCSGENAPKRLADLLTALTSLDFRWEQRLFRISASIGVAELGAGTDVAVAMKQADVACYAAKNAGRNRISVYRSEQSAELDPHRRIQLAADIHDSISQNRFLLFAQKITAVGNAGRPWYEILLRMRGGDGALLLPPQFIPAAERYDEMAYLDRWVLNTVLHDRGPALRAIPNIRLSINLSANTLNDPDFLPRFLGLLERSVLAPGALVLEITETSLINNLVLASNIIERLRRVGCCVALDDFGAGLGSFNYLRNFTVDFIKIEGTFVRNMVNNAVDLAIVKSINNIAHELHSQTVAKFVESEEILRVVEDMGIDFLQGFVVDRPKSIESLFSAE